MNKNDFELPEWIDRETWADYEAMRKKIRRPMTDRARRIAMKRLGQLSVEGYDPEEVMEQSIFMCWQGLFPISERGAWNGASKAEQRSERVRESIRQGLGVDSQLGRALRGELRQGADAGNERSLPDRIVGPKAKVAP